MHISGTLVLLVGLVGAFGSGCAVRVVGRAHVHASHDVVFHEAPTLVYVEPGVYVVRDHDVAVYYTDGYYWRYDGGAWYRASHWSDPWVTVHVGGVPHMVSRRDHRAYVRFRGSAGAQVFRQPHRRGHGGASASVGASAQGGSKHDGPSDGSPSKASSERRASVDADASSSVKGDRGRGDRGKDDGEQRGKSSHDDSRSKDDNRRGKDDGHGKARQPSESRNEAPSARRSAEEQPAPAQKKGRANGKKKSRR